MKHVYRFQSDQPPENVTVALTRGTLFQHQENYLYVPTGPVGPVVDIRFMRVTSSKPTYTFSLEPRYGFGSTYEYAYTIYEYFVEDHHKIGLRLYFKTNIRYRSVYHQSY